MTPKIFYRVWTVFLIVVAASTVIHASIDRGSIQGTVTDTSGAVVPGAKVIVKNVATNVEARRTTNTVGFYLVPELVPGKYSVHIESPGFSPVDITNVSVAAGTTTTTDAELQVGATTQRVEVTAASPLVERAPSNFTTALETRYIQDVPLQGRDIQMLAQLIPGVTQSTGPSGSLFGFNSQYASFPDPEHIVGSGISANGGQGDANAWYLDGSLNSALGADNVVVNPSPDAVSEFNVVDNGLAAEWGRTSGAVVNVVLKSGTNFVHGNIYEFNRNSVFSATNPFARRDARGRPFLQPRANMNNFGGTLGGPVYLPHVYNGKNRTFFFVSHDVTLLHETKPTILTVPLPNEKLGDFTGDPRFAPQCGVNGATNCLYDPYSTTGPDVNGLFHRTSFPTPVIPPSQIDPLAAFYLSTYPEPNFVDPLQQTVGGCGILCNNFLGNVISSQTTHNLSIKIDHTVSEKHKLFAEWLFNPSYYNNLKYPWNGPTAPTQTGLAGAQPYRTINQLFALGLTSTPSPTLVNEVRGAFTRQNIIATQNPDSIVNTSQVLQRVQGLNFVLVPPFSPVPTIAIGNPAAAAFLVPLGGFGPQAWQNDIQGVQAYTFLDNVTKVLGKQTVKGGLMFRRDNNWIVGYWPYSLGFGGSLTADPVSGQGGSGLAQFLLGAVDQGSGSGVYHSPWQTNDYWGFYVQDEYRISKNLALNVGMRYDIFGWFRERHDDLGIVNLNAPNPKVPFLGRIDYVGPAHPDRNIFPAHKSNFAPRLSLSWSPFGDRKTVVRTSFGIIYSNSIDSALATQNAANDSPGFSNPVGYSGDFTFQRPAFQLSQGAPPLPLPSFDAIKRNDEQFLGVGVPTFDRGDRDPYVEQWSLYVQRELPANMSLSIGYVGTHGLHLFGDGFRNIDHVPTAVRLKLRNHINDLFPTDPSLAPIYGCPIDPASSKGMCPGFIVFEPHPQWPSIGPGLSGDGFNRYHSFQMKLEKRYSRGLNFILAYTIQKDLMSVNTGSILGNTATPTTLARPVGRTSFIPGATSGEAGDGFRAAGAEDPDNRRRYTALGPDDIPQILNLAVTYELPVGRGRHFLNRAGPVDAILGGWKLVQNWNIQSGVPIIFSSPCNAVSCRPNLIGDPSRGRGSKTRQQLEDQWYDPTAFEAPFGSDPTVIQSITNGTADFNALDVWWRFGNIGLRPPTGRVPAYWNADFTLAKDLHLSEDKYFQFRWEVFNALNHQNLGIPNTNWCLPPNPDGSVDAIHQFGCQFGKITNIQTDPRAMEFGLRFVF